jgi:hypothetical protein
MTKTNWHDPGFFIQNLGLFRHLSFVNRYCRTETWNETELAVSNQLMLVKRGLIGHFQGQGYERTSNH